MDPQAPFYKRKGVVSLSDDLFSIFFVHLFNTFFTIRPFKDVLIALKSPNRGER